jgi:RNA polymerase sigma-70 factor (ECF subfamily)
MRLTPAADSGTASIDRGLPAVDDLVAAAASGDGDAFDRLVASRIDRTYRTARAILGNDPDARDVVQDAWLSAWRQVGTLRDRTAFDPWLDRIVVNACRSALRRRGAVREIPMPDVFDPAAGVPGPEHVTERDAVERAFERLDADKRAILVLHHVHGAPVAAIATALGIPEGTVKWRLHAARSALARAMEQER